jgi:hypothetical protein
MTNYALDAKLLSADSLTILLTYVVTQGPQSVSKLLAETQLSTPMGVRALQWLWKFDLVRIEAVK